jgi:uncharacterized protein
VSGTWVRGRNPHDQIGILIYVMMDRVAETLERAIAAGGKLVQPIGADHPEITARFSDPSGNIIGLYQQPK